MLRVMPRTLLRLCLCFVDAFAGDVLGYKRKHLDIGSEVFDFAFNGLLVGREAPGEAASDLKRTVLLSAFDIFAPCVEHVRSLLDPRPVCHP